EQDVSANRRPGQSGCNTRNTCALRDLALEPRRAQYLLQIALVDAHLVHVALGYLHRRAAHDCADLALEVSYPRLTRVVVDHALDRLVGDLELLRGQPVTLELTLDQILLRDLQLLLFGVARELDHFHTVPQRPGDRIEHIRGSDERHAR